MTSTAHPVRLSPPRAVVPSFSLTTRVPWTFGFAPAHKGTVSMCVMKRSGLAAFLPVPGSFTIKLPVWVGSGMRVWASSKAMASVGTPTSVRAATISRPIASSWPVMPGTERKRTSRSSAAA